MKLECKTKYLSKILEYPRNAIEWEKFNIFDIIRFQ